LHEPHYGLAVLIGAAVGTPGVAYLLALNNLVGSTLPTVAQVVAVIVFVCIEFTLVIVPFAFTCSGRWAPKKRSSGSRTGSPAASGRSRPLSRCSPAGTW
jgi:hypothetical protein